MCRQVKRTAWRRRCLSWPCWHISGGRCGFSKAPFRKPCEGYFKSVLDPLRKSSQVPSLIKSNKQIYETVGDQPEAFDGGMQFVLPELPVVRARGQCFAQVHIGDVRELWYGRYAREHDVEAVDQIPDNRFANLQPGKALIPKPRLEP